MSNKQLLHTIRTTFFEIFGTDSKTSINYSPISKEVGVVNVKLGLKPTDGAVHQDVVGQPAVRLGGGAVGGAGNAVWGDGGVEGVVETLLAGDGADSAAAVLGGIILSLPHKLRGEPEVLVQGDEDDPLDARHDELGENSIEILDFWEHFSSL